MFASSAASRLPRARVDVIDTPFRALSVMLAAMDPTMRFETIVLALDRRRRGMSIVVVNATDDPDALLGIVDAFTDRVDDACELGGLIVASVRPGAGCERDDLDRWAEASTLCAQSGIELVEWFVLGSGIECPRRLAGDPPRWKP